LKRTVKTHQKKKKWSLWNPTRSKQKQWTNPKKTHQKIYSKQIK
jgi:hypothetical protein